MRPVRARAVGLGSRILSSAIDGVLPTLALLAMCRAGAVDVDAYRAVEGIFAPDQILMRLYQHPRSLMYLPLAWMLLWTAFSLAFLGTVRTTPGKRILGLSILDGYGRSVSGLRLLLRIASGWLIPATLGLAFLWIVISPDRRGWHDLLSGTYVVRVRRERTQRDGSDPGAPHRHRAQGPDPQGGE